MNLQRCVFVFSGLSSRTDTNKALHLTVPIKLISLHDCVLFTPPLTGLGLQGAFGCVQKSQMASWFPPTCRPHINSSVQSRHYGCLLEAGVASQSSITSRFDLKCPNSQSVRPVPDESRIWAKASQRSAFIWMAIIKAMLVS